MCLMYVWMGQIMSMSEVEIESKVQIMKIAWLLLIIFSLIPTLHASEFSDFWYDNGKMKKLYTEMNLEEKTRVLEFRRDGADYMLKNIGRKCSQLADAPEYVRRMLFPKKVTPDTVCFTEKRLPFIYKELGQFDKLFEIKKQQHEKGENRLDTYQMQDWLYTLISYGHYKEAVAFFPKLVAPMLSEAQVSEMISKGEPPPENLSHSNISESWKEVLKIRNKPDEQIVHDTDDIALKMQWLFYTDNPSKREEALKLYRINKIGFMLDKAQKNWEGELKIKASQYYQELQKGTTIQIDR